MLVPFTSTVLGDYSRETAAVVLYAVNLAVREPRVPGCRSSTRTGTAPRLARGAGVRAAAQAGPANFLVAAVFGVSIPIAFVSPIAASVIWVAVFFVGKRLEDRVDAFSRRWDRSP